MELDKIKQNLKKAFELGDFDSYLEAEINLITTLIESNINEK